MSEAAYAGMSDEDVVALVKRGNAEAQEYIFNKYKSLVRMKARSYFLMGADREDIIQEGMIGLYKATRDYKKDREASFRVFADICINRQIMTAIKAATRQKHIPLNSYISLNKSAFDENGGDSSQTYMDLIKGPAGFDPESMFIGREDRSDIETGIIKALSTFEHKVLMLYLKGKSYSEISKITGKSEKSIDNALQRVKRKIEKIIAEKKLDI